MSNSFGFGGSNCSLVLGASALMQRLRGERRPAGPGADGLVCQPRGAAGRRPLCARAKCFCLRPTALPAAERRRTGLPVRLALAVGLDALAAVCAPRRARWLRCSRLPAADGQVIHEICAGVDQRRASGLADALSQLRAQRAGRLLEHRIALTRAVHQSVLLRLELRGGLAGSRRAVRDRRRSGAAGVLRGPLPRAAATLHARWQGYSAPRCCSRLSRHPRPFARIESADRSWRNRNLGDAESQSWSGFAPAIQPAARFPCCARWLDLPLRRSCSST